MAKKYTADTFEGGAANLTGLAVNTDDFVVTGSGGNVGIGESVPSKPLTINKNQSETAILVQSSDTGTAGIYIGGQSDSIKGGLILDNSDNSLQLRGYNNANRLHIDSSGNVGIGTTDPQKKLVISESTNATIRINSTKNGTWSAEEGLGHLEFFGNDTSGEGAAVKAKISATSKDTFGTAFNMTFGTTDGTTGISERMRIRYDGFVGIGETDPDRQLHLKSSLPAIRLEDSDVSGLYHEFFASSSGFFQFKADGGNVQANSGFLFQVDNSEKMRIEADGNVGIGTPSPQKLLHIASTSAQSVITLQRTNTNTSGAVGALQWTASDNHTVASMVALGDGNDEGAHITFNTTSAASSDNPFGISERMRIQSGGTVLVGKTSSAANTVGCELNPIGLAQLTRDGNLPLLVNRKTSDGTIVSIRRDNVQRGSISVSGSTTSYNETSDYRLKENVVDLTGALDRIEQLQPKRFNFISEETTVDGFIAHEVQSVIPEAVFGEKDAVNEDGNPEYQGIDKSKIVPLLVGAIKELKAEIETLKSQINS